MKPNCKVRPLLNRILVKRQAVEERTAKGIIIPDSARKISNEAIVVAVGAGVPIKGGNEIMKPDVKIGDVVILGGGGMHLEVDGEDYVLVTEEHIMAVFI
jgi:chaperonin GroES